jgi:hypothetical protein
VLLEQQDHQVLRDRLDKLVLLDPLVVLDPLAFLGQLVHQVHQGKAVLLVLLVAPDPPGLGDPLVVLDPLAFQGRLALPDPLVLLEQQDLQVVQDLPVLMARQDLQVPQEQELSQELPTTWQNLLILPQ